MPRNIQKWLQSRLFDEVPCSIAVIDRGYRIVENNRGFVEIFGDGKGRPCFEVYKRRSAPCESCMAAQTFADGRARVNEEVSLDKNGRPAHHLLHIAPVLDEHGGVAHIIEMSTDVTELKRLQREYHVLFERVPCYVAVLNRDLRIVRANEHLRATFGETSGQRCFEVLKRRACKCDDCPAESTFRDGGRHSAPQVGIARDGRETHYVVTTSPLTRSGGEVSYVIEMALDLTELKQLEREKVEAERLAAVGQTVAGLAHGIKNILTALEGGMYVVGSGLKTGRQDRIDQGWGMLERSIGRISTLVKNLLSFSKGRTPQVSMVDPGDLALEVVNLHAESAAQQGILLAGKIEEGIEPAPMDPEAIHSCLVNLVSNALDACQVSQKPACRVTLACREEAGAVVFEISDEGCGMDYDVKQKAFTNFFTTKGAGGTGLGLLLTHKIVQEHGGRIALESTPGEGSTFRLIFPRARLPRTSQSAP
jgi:PAS domain S-box-containing protein